MNDQHISFGTMSDLYDNTIPTEEEKEALVKHMDSCPSCRGEYEKLKNTIHFCQELRACEYPLPELCNNTINSIKSRRRKRMFSRAMPAIAASIIAIAGISLFDNGFFINSPGSSQIAKKSESRAGESEKVVAIIRNNDATVLRISDMFIEGKIKLARFNKLRRELGFRNVSYSLMGHTPIARQSSQWRSNIENVGTGNNGSIWQPMEYKTDAEEQYVIFRVYSK